MSFSSRIFLAVMLSTFVTVFAFGQLSGKIDLNAKQFFLFSYFKKQGGGALLALSTDGTHWEQLNGGQPVIVPQLGSQKLMRDPSINIDKNGIYRMVWTSGWKEKEIGYAESFDLIHWGQQKAIPVGEHIDSTSNCWAPEMFYDDIKKQYMIYWSSNVGEWKKMGSEGRIYYVTTKDFKSFSEPKILFKNGFPAGGAPGNDGPIDAFIYKDGKERYILFYKKDDNSRIPNVYYRVGKTPEGIWGEEFGPIKPSTGDEGPSVIKIGNRYCMFTDPFESDSAYVFSSNNLKDWKREITDLKMSHGTVIEISKETAIKLLKTNRNDTETSDDTNSKDGVLAPLLSINVHAQTTGADYFTGKWSVLVKGTPNGDSKMFVVLDKKDSTLTGTIQDSTGKEMFKIDKVELRGDKATVYFNTQGYDVNLEMNKKDDDHITGSMMGMFDAEGERVKSK